MINGKIYSIRTLTNENLIYIGSTKEPRLSARLSKHKSNYKEYLKGCYGYTTAFKIIELGDAYIEILEDCQNISRDELLRREGELIRKMDCVNKRIEGRTMAEYKQDNLEKIKSQQKDYYLNHKQAINDKDKINYQNNRIEILKKLNEKYTCICGRVLKRGNRNYHNKKCINDRSIDEQLIRLCF